MRRRADRGIRRLNRRLRRAGLPECTARAENGTCVLEGEAAGWDDRVAAGFLAARFGFRGVVNDIAVPGREEPPMPVPPSQSRELDGATFDAVIIGAGVIGCAIARELAAWDLRIACIEKEEDVAVHTSSRNDGMVHPGFAPKPGTKKAAYNVRGNRLYTKAARELGFALRRPGSILLFEKRWYRLLVPLLKRRCRKNRVDGDYRYVSPAEIEALEPNATHGDRGGFLLPSAGVVNPFEVTIAYAEDAAARGVSFRFATAVTGMSCSPDGAEIATVETTAGALRAGVVVNAAGNWADVVAGMAADRFFSLHPRRGAMMIVDKRVGSSQRHILSVPRFFASERSHTKGGGLVPCIEGNLLGGPTAVETHERENYATSADDIRRLESLTALNGRVSRGDVITYFAGVRAATWEEDFVIERSRRRRNLVHAAGLQSPGLASAPAIAEDVAAMAAEVLAERGEVHRRAEPLPRRRARLRPAAMPLDERAALVRRDPAYGRIICRCEEVSEGEVRDALLSPLAPRSLDAVKRRTRAGAGRCHGGFCLPRLLAAISRHGGVAVEEIHKNSADSPVVLGRTKAPEALHGRR